MKKATFSIIGLFIFVMMAGHSYGRIWTITAGNSQFTPNVLTDIPTGDTIKWKWVNGTNATISTQIPEGALDWDAPLNSSDTIFMYVTTVPGTYHYTSTNPDMTGSFTVRNASGINDKESALISVYPDPFTDKFTVDGKGAVISSVKMYDMTGNIIRISEEASEKVVMDNFPALAPGGYIISVTLRDNRTFSKRIIHR